MKLDYNETIILTQAIRDMGKNSKSPINKVKLIENLYALGVHTDKKYTFLRISVKSLISKIDKLSDDDINLILADYKAENIVTSFSYQLPDATSRQQP